MVEPSDKSSVSNPLSDICAEPLSTPSVFKTSTICDEPLTTPSPLISKYLKSKDEVTWDEPLIKPLGNWGAIPCTPPTKWA